ncbi:hypothetical protein [Methylovirgula sp. 4M-Z18]|uniref:hypothetical protein n=1 Tax=Methylovirgula sp. 4M-Z18 TaxID=2293567 RepID=UPI000E2F37C2|nr:hypothetical protein [Methylovirgula sp. 4M-Z18]RFB76605.1 hypothetical protein DYH55_19240 [Methylovirgula sp. 4M-Z18]
MSYHLRIVQGSPLQVWWIDDNEAYRVGVGDPKQGIGTYFKAETGETIRDAIYRQASGYFGSNVEWPFHKTNLGPGQFYPRISRPVDEHPHDGLGWNRSAQIELNIVAIARGQLSALTRQLDRICQTVHPKDKALETFGHDIRNLLILACTEVETHWRGVLIANGAAQIGDRLKTFDYVKLNGAMKLGDYAVAFPNYPWLPPFKPFAGWGSSGKPTQELEWYDAYNAVKHDRESTFERATLLRVFEAISACAVMIAAQFGLPAGLGEGSELRSFFQFIAVPQWLLSEIYILPYESPTGEWTAVNFRF